MAKYVKGTFTFDYVNGTSETFSVQFNDLAVPDSSSTLGMLFLSAAAMLGAARVLTVCSSLKSSWGGRFCERGEATRMKLIT
jgi:hypothetical protein